MIYVFNNKYYVNIGPMIYSEIIPTLKGDKLTFSVGNSKLELYNPPLTINLDEIKEKLQQDKKPKEEKKTNKRITRW